MNQKFTSNNIDNEELTFNTEELTLNTEESDYKNLVTRLREISSTIALLEKTIFG